MLGSGKWLILPNSEPLSSPRLGYLVCDPIDEKPIDFFFFFFWEAAWNHEKYREIWGQVVLSLLSCKSSGDSAHQLYHGEGIFQPAWLRMSWWRSNEELWKTLSITMEHLVLIFYHFLIRFIFKMSGSPGQISTTKWLLSDELLPEVHGTSWGCFKVLVGRGFLLNSLAHENSC